MCRYVGAGHNLWVEWTGNTPVFGRDVPLKEQPSSLMRFGSLCGIVIISIVEIAYCYVRWNA